MASAGGKKKGKVKGKTVNLNEFLGGGSEPTTAPGSSYVLSNWADASEEVDDNGSDWQDDYGKSTINRTSLPTAPRSAQDIEIDKSMLPDKPPYTVFLGNLPYDIEEEDIVGFFRGCNVTQVRLPRDGDGGRLKGFGYAEIGDMESLMMALKLGNENLRNRRIRVDLAGQQGDTGRESSNDWRRDRMGGSGYGRGGEDEQAGRSEGSWDRPTASTDSYDDGPGSRDGYRGGGGGGYSRDRGGFDGDGYRSRGGDRYGSSYGSGYSNDGGYGGSKSFGRDRDKGYGGGGFDRERRGYDDRGGGGGSRGYSSNYGDRDGGYNDAASDEPAKERKKLVLKPRTQPVDTPAPKPQPEATKPTKTTKPSQASIFGGAKPVDTAAKERQIEERLKREQETEKAEVEESRRNRQINRERPRRDSERSNEEGRTRHSSSSSTGKGPKPVMLRRESERSDDECKKDDQPLSPKSPKSPTSPPPRKEDPSKVLVPAPAPKENVWARRSEVVTTPRSETAPTLTSDSSTHRKAPHGRDERIKSDSRSPPREEPHRKNDNVKKPREIPKYEEKEAPDFAQKNKFAGLEQDDDLFEDD